MGPAGKWPWRTRPRSEVAAGAAQPFNASATLAKPALWSQEEPNLYYVVATVEAQGKLCDRERVAFGVRSLSWDPDQGFSLNGKKTLLKGTCNHQDHAGVGAAIPDSLQTYRLSILKEAGCNAIRTSHNFPTPELIEACDRMGFWCFARPAPCRLPVKLSPSLRASLSDTAIIPPFSSGPSARRVVHARRPGQRGLAQPRRGAGRVIRSMQAHAHRLDPTRMCTAAINGYYNTDLADSLDVVGFNYNYSVPMTTAKPMLAA